MDVNERAIPLEGSVNLRDLGGYRTVSGRQVQPGLLYRSGTLAHLTAKGQRQFADLGISLICDLRRADEKQQEPTPFPVDAPARLEIPIDPGSAIELRRRMADSDLSLRERIHYMTGLTGELTRDHTHDYVKMFDGMLAMQSGGFLVHCSAGKDRTGVAVALILHALGVPEQTVIEDYLLTNHCIDYEGYILPKWLAHVESDQASATTASAGSAQKEAIMALAGVREEYLHAAYTAIKSKFDSTEHYIVEAIGLDHAARAELRRRFLA